MQSGEDIKRLIIGEEDASGYMSDEQQNKFLKMIQEQTNEAADQQLSDDPKFSKEYPIPLNRHQRRQLEALARKKK